MKLNSQNLRIVVLILRFWMESFFRVTILHPSSYLLKITSEKEVENSMPIEKKKIIKKVVKGVNMISPLFAKRRKCLIEALITYKTLSKLGLAPSFRLGVKKDNNRLITHAWIDINGNTIIGGPVSGYRQLFRTH